MSTKRSVGLIITLSLVLALAPWHEVRADTFTVTKADNSGSGSLRWAIEQANAHPGPDTIEFTIQPSDCPLPTKVCTIRPLSALPPLSGGGTTIDGYSQGDGAPATADEPAEIYVEIDGSLAGASTFGLRVTSSDNVIRGLSITDFSSDGIAIGYEGTTNNVVAGNFLGLRPNGSAGGNGHSGVFIGAGAQGNLIGGDEPAERNILSGNQWSGAELHNTGTTSNTVAGNYIGTDPDGTVAVPNALYGVRVYGGAQYNTIGGDTVGECNVISGNTEDGVRIMGSETASNTIAGNYIGTAPDGTTALANGSDGVAMSHGAHHNLVGGDTSSERNVISGNTWNGVSVTDDAGRGTAHNTISGNYLGVAADGATALQNGWAGVSLRGGPQYTTIGGDTAGERNVLSGNDSYGVFCRESMSNTIAGNYIGTDAEGTRAVGNRVGVYVVMASHSNTIGPGNLLSGNDHDGIVLWGEDTMTNTVVGNYVGTDASGQTGLPNGFIGVSLSAGTQHNVIGGGTDEARNVISGNGTSGVGINGEDTAWNYILGNYIGTSADGTTALGNTDHGILIANGVRNTAAQGNVISANGYGVSIRSNPGEVVNTSHNVILENHIGVAADGASPLGNTVDGVHIGFQGQSNSVVANVIAHNGADGVSVDTPLAFENLILVNSIHDNDGLGIHLTNGANHEIEPPVIDGAEAAELVVSGRACPDCYVQVFASHDEDGEGERPIGAGPAGPTGDFDVEVISFPYRYLTATASDADDGTSEFSDVFNGDLPQLSTSSKAAGPSEPVPGGVVVYTITVSNTGTGSGAATVTDTLPTNVTWADSYSVSTGSLTWDAGGNQLVWTGTVAAGTAETITFQVTVDEDLVDGTVISNTAELADGIGNVHELGPANVTVRWATIYLPVLTR